MIEFIVLLIRIAYNLALYFMIWNMIIRKALLAIIDNVICKKKTDLLFISGWRRDLVDDWYVSYSGKYVSMWILPFMSYQKVVDLIENDNKQIF